MDSALAKAVAQVESAGFPYAMRFEAGLYGDFVRAAGQGPSADCIKAIEQGNRCNWVTALAIYCTSFGLFQIMGMTLYSTCGWTNAVAPFMFDPEQQLAMFNKFCAGIGVDPATFDWSDAALLSFATRYNGPGSPQSYADKLKAAYAGLPK